MRINKGPEKISDIISTSKAKKPPAYQWQELALRIVEELGIPKIKRSAVFKVCKEKPRNIIEKCLNDTKELCQTGQKWRYFFKLINEYKKGG